MEINNREKKKIPRSENKIYELEKQIPIQREEVVNKWEKILNNILFKAYPTLSSIYNNFDGQGCMKDQGSMTGYQQFLLKKEYQDIWNIENNDLIIKNIFYTNEYLLIKKRIKKRRQTIFIKEDKIF